MGLIGMIEEAVRLDAELQRIRSYDADAPEEQELKRRIRRINVVSVEIYHFTNFDRAFTVQFLNSVQKIFSF